MLLRTTGMDSRQVKSLEQTPKHKTIEGSNQGHHKENVGALEPNP